MLQRRPLFTGNFFFRAFLLIAGTVLIIMGWNAQSHGYDPRPLWTDRFAWWGPNMALWTMLLGAAMIFASLFPWP